MNRQQARYEKLTKNYFLPSEANALKDRRLSSPDMKALLKERREVVRAYREQGYTKTEIKQRISNESKAAGFRTNSAHIRREITEIAARPEIIKATRRQEVIRTGFRDRLHELKDMNLSYTGKELRDIAKMTHLIPENRNKEFKTYVSQYKELRDSKFTPEQAKVLAQFDAKSPKQQAAFERFLESQSAEVERRILDIMRSKGLDHDQATNQYNKRIKEEIDSGESDPWDLLRDILSPSPGGSHKATKTFNPSGVRNKRAYGNRKRK